MGSRRRADNMPKYLYDIPYGVRRTVCKILDVEDDWKFVATKYDIHNDDIRDYEREHQRPGGSPADRLLTRMGHRCYTVQDLYFQLCSLNLKRASDALRGVVPDYCIKEAERQIRERECCGMPSNVTSSMPCETDELSDLPPRTYNESRRHPVESDHNENPGASESSDSNQSKPDNQPSFGSSVNYQPEDPDVPKPWHAAHPNKQVTLLNQETQQTAGITPGTQNIPVGSPDGNRSAESQGKQDDMYLTFGNNNAAYSTLWHFPYESLVPLFESENIVGKGGFGEVYKGKLSEGPLIAVKKLKKKTEGVNGKEIDKKSQLSEIKALMKFHHENIITLMGYSEDGPELCLVYEFMLNGSLDDRLRCKNDTHPLPWRHRHQILTDAARGIYYLHTSSDKPLIHGDIKSANILLDNNMVAKIADFGLAVEATRGTGTKVTHYSTTSQFFFGSQGYLPDELYKSGMRYNVKTDVYSFGIIIYETCTALKAMDKSRGRNNEKLKEYVENVQEKDKTALFSLRDPLTPDWPDQRWLDLVSLGGSCSHEKKNTRPEMKLVLEKLVTMFQQIQAPGTLGENYGNNSFLSSNVPGSERSYNMMHVSGGPGRSLQAWPSPQWQDNGGPSYPPPPEHNKHIQEKPGAIIEEPPEYENQECVQRKIHEMRSFDNQTPLKEHQFELGGEESSTSIVHNNRSIGQTTNRTSLSDGPDDPRYLAYDPNKLLYMQECEHPTDHSSYHQFPTVVKSPSGEPEAFLLQRHYDALHQTKTPDTDSYSDSVRLLKVDRSNYNQAPLSVEADEDSGDECGRLHYENPVDNEAPLPERHTAKDHNYKNQDKRTWNEDHDVELIRQQMKNVYFKPPVESQNEVMSMPPPQGHRKKADMPYGSMPLHMNAFRHNTERLQNDKNYEKEGNINGLAQHSLSSRGQESMIIPPNLGQRMKLKNKGGRVSPDELSDTEEDETNEVEYENGSITSDIIKKKCNKQFPSVLPAWDQESSLGESEDQSSIMSSDTYMMEDSAQRFGLVMNADSGLYETDPGFSSAPPEHCGASYMNEMGLSVERGRSYELSSSPSTPTRSSVLNTPSSPPIYASAGRYQTEST